MGRTEPPIAGDEAAAMIGSLERQRALFAWKCGGLDATALNTALSPSTMTLGGLLKHVACVEDTHFARLWLAEPPPPPWADVDWDGDPDWEWTSAALDTPDALMAQWQTSVRRSRGIVEAALRDGGLDQLGAHRTKDGQSPNLRRILFDLVEEYARHLGHADLIRESVDGLTGEDLPED